MTVLFFFGFVRPDYRFFLALRQNLWVKMSDFVKGGSGLRAEGFIALVPIPKGGRERRTDAMGRCALQSWPLGRRSGRFPPLPYPPPKP